MLSPETQAKIAAYRLKATVGELTLEDCQDIVRHLREGRVTAAAASDGARRKKAIAAIPSAADMLGDMMGGDSAE